MDETRRNNINRRVTPMVTPKPKAPPPPKPKPPKLSTMVSNKVDSDPISSSKKANTNGRGSNVHRLSSVFEDKDDKGLKPRIAPSLPLSPRLPVPTVTVKKQKSFSREKGVNSNLKPEIDESSLRFGDIKARFQQAQVSDGALPNPTKKPAALTNNKTATSKSTDITKIEKNANNVNKTCINTNTKNTKTMNTKKPIKSRSLDPISQSNPTTPTITDDDENFSREWIDVSEHNYLPEIDTKKATKSVRGASQPPPVKTKKPKPLRLNSSNDVSSTKKRVSEDFEAKRASIANLLASSSQSPQRNSEHKYETSKALPPTPPPKSPTESSSSPSTLRISVLPSSNRPKSQISLPGASSASSDPEEDEYTKDFRRRKKLWNVIKELVETERVFFQDMVLLEEVYSVPAQEIPIFNRFDCKTIFNNLQDVIDFSEDFLNLLENAAGIEGPDDNNADKHLENENDNTSIGAAFMQMMERKLGNESRMEAVYSEYCKRHEAAVQKLQEFDKDENVQGWLQKCKNLCEGRTRSWDIASLLIKPVQRVLKYPLLLQQIVSLTNPSHPDFEELKRAFTEIQNVAERINEIKRRKDIVEKIVGSKKKTDADLVHGITKSITRRGQMIKHATGIAKATEDDLYKFYVEKFKNLELQGQQLSKDIKEWVKIVKLYFEDQQRVAETFEEFYMLDEINDVEHKKLVEYVKAIKEIAPTHGKEMEEAVKKNIYPQIEKYLELFKAPAAVMKKRERKVLDYDRARSIKSKGGTPDRHLQQSADAYESISAQLREELPSFFKLMTQYFDIIVQEFIKIQSKLYQQIGMDFRQYFCKFVDTQALEHVSNNRELVLREMDITLEYTHHYHGVLGVDDQLKSFVLLTGPTGLISGPNLNNNGRGRSPGGSLSDSSGSSRKADNVRKRSVSKDPKDHRKAGWWDENTDRLSWNSSSSNTLRNSLDISEFNFNSVKQKQANKYSSHKKYATDSAVAIYDNDEQAKK
ncbi:Rho guanyl nucleotide exchange factor [Rhizophagus clarus]|uniref:Rho guanyl nucleotide exchange factor n=1 Tax=Rhizophagus clarus TaxID=94130 RepID=A0A8H3LD30_9GLOM|nr:Rho guanyl nucleotide exchange factor [Rhizophagus clarus]